MLPPDVVDEISYHKWVSKPQPRTHRRFLSDANGSVELEVPVHQFLPEEFWRSAWENGHGQQYEHERPYGPFDDVQCHVCGNYNYAKNAPECCQKCGTEYDWEWNVRTGRVSRESVPDGALD